MVMIALLLSLLGWALLSLGLPRHYKSVIGCELPVHRARPLRAGGWTAMLAALALCIPAYGWGEGPIFWASALVLGALAWVLLMTALVSRRPGNGPG
ncbi:MAG: DUF3325 domain-containing protein [Lysobacter spongiicola]|nr:DUF3325 domain-containing protein [Lysobacter spongiicola]